MIVAVHQPNYIPWLGYFFKIARCDKFVFLDDAQYTKNSFINRNRIKTPTGELWLTIPARTAGQLCSPILEITTDVTQRWPEKHLNTLNANYRRAPHFEEVIERLKPVYRSVKRDTSLADFNIALIQEISGFIGLCTPMVRSSKMSIATHSTERLVDIARILGANEYLSGRGGMGYQDEVKFSESAVRLTYSDFVPTPYPQLWGEFRPDLSILDVIMNCGGRSLGLA